MKATNETEAQNKNLRIEKGTSRGDTKKSGTAAMCEILYKNRPEERKINKHVWKISNSRLAAQLVCSKHSIILVLFQGHNKCDKEEELLRANPTTGNGG